MTKLYRIASVVLIGTLAAGCADQEIKPSTVLCPLLGGALGAGVAAAASGRHSEGAYAAGAVLGAAAGYFLCREHYDTPTPAPTPAVAPAPAPTPAPVAAPPKDSDGDGVIDANDKCPGTPAGVKVNAQGCPEVGQTLASLQGVNFDFDKATLKPEAPAILDKAADALKAAPSIAVRVEGHTDSRGSDAYNMTLSDKRAKTVVAYLVSKGIGADRLTAVGMGKGAPVAPNDTAANMAKNRRVDLVVSKN